jgi:hypothetical protein
MPAASTTQRGLTQALGGRASVVDWSYSYFAFRDGALGLLALLFPVPWLAAAASPGRRRAASWPGLVGATLFLIFCLAAGSTTRHSPSFLTHLPAFGLLLTIGLVPTSVRAQRNRWTGLLHLLTIAGALFTWLVAAMAVSHDWL